MKVTELWVYPIKALRGIRLDAARLGQQGLEHDRCFMLCKVDEDSGELSKMQLDKHPECALLEQEIVGERVRVRYVVPEKPLASTQMKAEAVLEVPLKPDIKTLQKTHINLHQSLVVAYRMGARYDEWFSAYFGFTTALIYIGDGRRPVLGTFAPAAGQQRSLLSSLSHRIFGRPDDSWLTFTDCAPYLITTRASLANVSARLAANIPMHKFRPNIVLDGEAQWDEDFWTQLCFDGRHVLTLTKLCNRCASVNVDYDSGRVGAGQSGRVLNELMKDRRVDEGAKWAPIFGRYAFLTSSSSDNVAVAVGDSVVVTARATKRPVFDWPIKDPKQARYYQPGDKDAALYLVALALSVVIALLGYHLQ